MCKLIGWISGSPVSLKKAQEALLLSRKLVGKSERDGFGFAQAGGLLGRYVVPADFKGIGAVDRNRVLMGNLWDKLPVAKRIIESGSYDPVQPMIIHGRTSTNSVSLDCTHPFVVKDAVLAHNGVVSRLDNTYPRTTLCDTEHLANSLGENSLVDAIKDIEASISGYAAILGFKAGRLIVARDKSAQLTITPFKLKGKRGYVFATVPEHGEAIADVISTKSGDATEFPPATLWEFDHEAEISGVYEFKLAWSLRNSEIERNWELARGVRDGYTKTAYTYPDRAAHDEKRRGFLTAAEVEAKKAAQLSLRNREATESEPFPDYDPAPEGYQDDVLTEEQVRMLQANGDL